METRIWRRSSTLCIPYAGKHWGCLSWGVCESHSRFFCSLCGCVYACCDATPATLLAAGALPMRQPLHARDCAASVARACGVVSAHMGFVASQAPVEALLRAATRGAWEPLCSAFVGPILVGASLHRTIKQTTSCCMTAQHTALALEFVLATLL